MTFTKELAQLPDGNHICYMDSGPMKDSGTYTAVIMLHGSGFNSYVFMPLHEFAAQYRLRLFVVQRKGYAGSSAYSDDELEGLRAGDSAFLDQSAILLGHLIAYLITKHDLPEPNAECTEGGVILLAWSMGNAAAIPLFSDAGLFGQELYELLRRYLRKFVLYDSPYSAFAFHAPEEKSVPYSMSAEALEEYTGNLKAFAGSYYDQPAAWNGDPAELVSQPSPQPATTDSWSSEFWEEVFEAQVTLKYEWPMILGPIQALLRERTERAFFDEACVKATFPNVPFVHIACWKSSLHDIWGYHCMKTLYEERRSEGRFVRPLSFLVVMDVNHFWHWESPHEFLLALTIAVNGDQSIHIQTLCN
ncbi:hypothetical protein AN958_06573 [Leucoagaricus sp. SymC.cos]|nr:hypothetical protein AN958_06573 [Leucoagaricus sp. SymC.cos]